MERPEYRILTKISPDDVKEMRRVMEMTQANFGRLFPVEFETVRSWESGRRNSYGPCTFRLMEIKAYTDHVTEEKRLALERLMKK